VRHSVEKGPPLDDTELGKLQKKTYGYTLGQFHPELNPLGIIPSVSFSNITNAANITYDERTPLRGADTLITFTDNITYTLASHNLKAGFYAERARNYEGATSTFAGNFTFSNDTNNPLNTGYAYSNAVLGNFTQYAEASFRPSGEGRQSLVGFFSGFVEGDARLSFRIWRALWLVQSVVSGHRQFSGLFAGTL
jgi:hypothetical protein